MSATMTLRNDDASRPWKDLLVLLCTNVVISGLAYVSNVGLANKMGPSLFGEYSYVLIVGTFLNQFVLFGSDQLMIRKYMSYGDEGIAKIFRVRLVNLALVTLGIVGWTLVTRDWKLLYSLIFAAQSLSLPSVYEVHRQNRIYALLYLAERALYILWLWAGIYYLGTANLHWVFGSLTLWTGLSVCLQVYSKRHSLRSEIRSPLSSVWAAGSGLMVFNFAKYVYGGGTRLFIKQGLGYSALGVYSAVWQFVPLGTMYLTQITKSWRLRLTESVHSRNYSAFRDLMRQMLLIIMGPMAIGSFVLLMGGEKLLAAVFSKDYSGAVKLFPWLVGYMAVVAFDAINTMLWVALGKIKPFTVLFCLFSGLCLVLCSWGQSRFNLENYFGIVILCHGLAVATSLACLVPLLRKNFVAR